MNYPEITDKMLHDEEVEQAIALIACEIRPDWDPEETFREVQGIYGSILLSEVIQDVLAAATGKALRRLGARAIGAVATLRDSQFSDYDLDDAAAIFGLPARDLATLKRARKIVSTHEVGEVLGFSGVILPRLSNLLPHTPLGGPRASELGGPRTSP